MGFGGADPPLRHTNTPGGREFGFRPPCPLLCPDDALVPHWACPPFVRNIKGGGGWGGLMGRWVMVTQITPHHTAYFHSTPNSIANRTAAFRTALVENGSQLHWIIISRAVTCSAGRSCDPLVRTNRVAAFPGQSERKRRRKKKIIFPLRYSILQHRKWSSTSS